MPSSRGSSLLRDGILLASPALLLDSLPLSLRPSLKLVQKPTIGKVLKRLGRVSTQYSYFLY